MTGYKPNSSPWVYISKDGAMYPAERIVSVMLIIKDGSRIGLTDNFPVANSASMGGCTSCSPFQTNLTNDYWRCESNPSCSAYVYE
jgi:hypothetical protein